MKDGSEEKAAMPIVWCQKRWGDYTNLIHNVIDYIDQHKNQKRRVMKVKQLAFRVKGLNEKWDPKVNHLSYQKHLKRGEIWFLISGCGILVTNPLPDPHIGFSVTRMISGEVYHIPSNTWHTVFNGSHEMALKILEIQIGEECEEEDIQRMPLPKHIYKRVEDSAKYLSVEEDFRCVAHILQ